MTTPSVETKMLKAITAHVATLPISATHDIVWTAGEGQLQTESGTTYIPQATTPYIRCTWTPNRPSREGRVSNSLPALRMGVLQIDVYDPRHRPTLDAVDRAGKIAEHFPLDFCMSYQGVGVSVMGPPFVGRVRVETHTIVPVLIETRTYA